MLGNIVLLASCFADVYMVYMFFSGFFDKKRNIGKNNKIICYLGAVTVMYLLNLSGMSTFNLIVIPFILFAYVYYLFEGKLIAKIMCFIMNYSVLIGAEFIAAILTGVSSKSKSLVNISDAPYFLFNIKLITFILILLIRQIVGKKKERMVNKIFWTYLLIPFSSIIMMFVAFFISEKAPAGIGIKAGLSISCGFMLFSNILVFIGFHAYSENLYSSMQKELIISKEKANSLYYKKIAETKEERKMLIHDTKHYLAGLRSMIYAGDKEGAVELLNNLDGRITKNEMAVYTDIPLLDAMLTDKKNQAQETGVDFKINVQEHISLNKIPEIEYMVMLSNLIDNAVRGASERKDGKVLVNIAEENNKSFLISKIVNDLDRDKIKIKNGSFVSTKKENGIHGVGLSSVEKMAEECNGTLVTKITDSSFTATLMLPEE